MCVRWVGGCLGPGGLRPLAALPLPACRLPVPLQQPAPPPSPPRPAPPRPRRKGKSFSRRRAFRADKDVDYINDRNAHFNKKIQRAFGAATAEIKANLERGTALPDH